METSGKDNHQEISSIRVARGFLIFVFELYVVLLWRWLMNVGLCWPYFEKEGIFFKAVILQRKDQHAQEGKMVHKLIQNSTKSVFLLEHPKRSCKGRKVYPLFSVKGLNLFYLNFKGQCDQAKYRPLTYYTHAHFRR